MSGLKFTEDTQPLVIRKWPPYPSFQEVSIVRRERVALLIALGKKDLEYVDKYLSTTEYEGKTIFWLHTIANIVWPAKEHLKFAALPRDFLYHKMKTEGYDDEVIKQYMSGLLD